MKEIKLTKGYVALVDDEDFDRINAFTWCSCVCRRTNGEIRTVYAMTSLPSSGTGKHRTQLMHRLVMGATTGQCIDHRDHNGLNNQKSNLRLATRQQNNGNTRRGSGNTSGFKGVVWYKSRNEKGKHWAARIKFNRKLIHLGFFPTPQEAHTAYRVAAVKYFGEFACTD